VRPADANAFEKLQVGRTMTTTALIALKAAKNLYERPGRNSRPAVIGLRQFTRARACQELRANCCTLLLQLLRVQIAEECQGGFGKGK
jgi:hypothetical protein